MGHIVAKVEGNHSRYDLVIEIDGKLSKIQCKTGNIKDGVISFNTSSITYHSETRDYRGQIDHFAVYVKDLDTCYLIPVNECGISKGYLRINGAKNNQFDKIHWAKNYELACVTQFGRVDGS